MKLTEINLTKWITDNLTINTPSLLFIIEEDNDCHPKNLNLFIYSKCYLLIKNTQHLTININLLSSKAECQSLIVITKQASNIIHQKIFINHQASNTLAYTTIKTINWEENFTDIYLENHADNKLSDIQITQTIKILNLAEISNVKVISKMDHGSQILLANHGIAIATYDCYLKELLNMRGFNLKHNNPHLIRSFINQDLQHLDSLFISLIKSKI